MKWPVQNIEAIIDKINIVLYINNIEQFIIILFFKKFFILLK